MEGGFIRGLIDTDGGIGSKGEIVLALISEDLINQSSDILKKFDIEHKKFAYNSKPPRKALYGIRIIANQVKNLDIIPCFAICDQLV